MVAYTDVVKISENLDFAHLIVCILFSHVLARLESPGHVVYQFFLKVF